VQREIEKTYRRFGNLQVISTPGTGVVKMSITSKKVDELKNNIDVLILQIDNLQSKTEKSNIISHLKAGLRLITEDDSNSQQLNIKRKRLDSEHLSDEDDYETGLKVPGVKKLILSPYYEKNFKDGHYYCEFCDFITEKEHNLRSHMSRHTSNIKCDICDVYFSRAVNLKRHNEGVTHKAKLLELQSNAVPTSNEQDPIPCIVCGSKFQNEEELETHMEVHMFKCEDCSVYFPDEERFNDHMLSHSSPEYKIIEYKMNNNHVCDPDVSTEESSSKNPFKCNICGKAYNRKEYLTQHLVEHTDKYKCQNCSLTFSNKRRLEIHGRNPTNCAKLLKFRESFRKRQSSGHQEDKPPVDDHSKVFEETAIIERTKEKAPDDDSSDSETSTSQGEMNKSFNASTLVCICQHCGLSLTSEQGLKRHMEIMHYVDQSEFQIVNNDSDESEENYEKEVKEVDMFHCDKCDKLFSSLRSLKNHLISHTDRFQCSSCYQGFSCQKYLDLHKKNKSNCERLMKKRSELKSNSDAMIDVSEFVEAVIDEEEFEFCSSSIKINNNPE